MQWAPGVSCALYGADRSCKTRTLCAARTWTCILPSLRANGSALCADPLARNDELRCLKFESEIQTASRLPLQRALVQHLQHQFHGHQHRIVAARQPALGEAAEIIDQRDIEVGFQRAAGA